MKTHNIHINEFIDSSEIESIEYIGEFDTIDITVADVHMFIADGIITHNSGVDSDVIEGDSISESFGKMFTADFVASISRKSKDKMNKTARVHIIKNRLGPDGITFPEYIDTAKSKIEIFDAKTDEGQKTNDTMVSDVEYRRQQLASLYNKQQKNLF